MDYILNYPFVDIKPINIPGFTQRRMSSCYNANKMNIHDNSGKIVKKKKLKKKYMILPKDNNNNKQEKVTNVFLKKDVCKELYCENEIKVKSELLCEYHYRKKRLFIINKTIGGCIYSKECRNKIFRAFLCNKHYKLKLNKDKENNK